jgi:hypothetical protein
MQHRRFVAVLLLAYCASAEAQMIQGPTEVQIGPVDLPQEIQGIQIVTRVTTFMSVSTSPAGISVKARIFADMRDLQARIGSIIDTMALPKDNCHSYSGNNPVVTLYTKKLTINGTAVTLTIGGDVDVWDCRENPIPNSKIEMVNEKWLGVSVSRPKVVTWPGNPIKNKLLTQPVTASIPATLDVSSDTAVGVHMGAAHVELGGQALLSSIRDTLLTLFRVDLDSLAQKALRSSVDESKLQLAIPDDFKRLNPKITKASFLDLGGVGAEIDAEALVAGANLTELLKAIADQNKASQQ